jgi:para-nitrobenzyl esterase
MTDRYFRHPTLDAAQARLSAGGPAPTYLYEFAWQSPVLGMGAAHAMEIPFVFDNLTCADAQTAIGTDAPAALAQEMHAAWIRFASTGDPGWPPFDASYPVMIFGGEQAGVVLDPRSNERQSWVTA